MNLFRRPPKSAVAEVVELAPLTPKPRWPLDLRAAGCSDEEIVRFAIDMPFSDLPGKGEIAYHQQGRDALARILHTGDSGALPDSPAAPPEEGQR